MIVCGVKGGHTVSSKMIRLSCLGAKVQKTLRDATRLQEWLCIWVSSGDGYKTRELDEEAVENVEPLMTCETQCTLKVIRI